MTLTGYRFPFGGANIARVVIGEGRILVPEDDGITKVQVRSMHF